MGASRDSSIWPKSGGTRPRPEALYYHIAQNAAAAAEAEVDGFARAQAIVTAMVFSALCLEAFVNQEYADHSETIAIMRQVDRMSLELKWQLLPLLLGAKTSFDQGRQPYQSFRQLVNIRNERLVHFKPIKEMEGGEVPTRLGFADLITDVSRARSHVKCIGDMIRTLNELTSGRTSIPEFLSGTEYSSEVRAVAGPITVRGLSPP